MKRWAPLALWCLSMVLFCVVWSRADIETFAILAFAIVLIFHCIWIMNSIEHGLGFSTEQQQRQELRRAFRYSQDSNRLIEHLSADQLALAQKNAELLAMVGALSEENAKLGKQVADLLAQGAA